MQKILVIQTAFIGDAILATPVLEKLHQFYPKAQLDFLIRKGNESLFGEHPFLRKLMIWDKNKGKYKNLWNILTQIRSEKYDLVINLQRFLATGILTAFSGAKQKIGFSKNPLSWTFDKHFAHELGNGTHEVARNLSLISHLTDSKQIRPALYPSTKDYELTQKLKSEAYLCLAPTSVWFTKQFPTEKWVEFLQKQNFEGNIYLLGAKTDRETCEQILQKSGKKNIINLAGELNLLQSTALMKDAIMNFVNDSAPMHLASSVNANTCAIFCSTIKEFGFYPLSENATIIEYAQKLSCRPCGIHGHQACPEKHFTCGFGIEVSKMIDLIK
ncbi:MAG: glycosyltransferase family 9 protein [Bacteroidetes bacterium]|nr:MAG: glycosyltransferase family 9 protein [Bacteroidota bacterium]